MAQPNSLVTRLAAGTVLINLFVYALVGLTLFKSHQQYELQTEITTQNLTHSLEINVSGILDKIDVGLSALANETRRQLDGGGIKGNILNEYMSKLLTQLPEFEAMWVTDEKGSALYGTKIPIGKPINIADREYFTRLLKNQGTGLIISKPVIGRITKDWSVLVCKRINRPDGSFAGVAFGSLRVVDYFTNMFSTIDVGRRGVIALRDEELGAIVRYPKTTDAGDQVGSKILTDKTLDMVRAHPDSGSYTVTTKADNIERTYSYRKISCYPFYIFVAQSTNDYLLPWRKEAGLTLSLLAFFTLVTILLARVMHKRTDEMLTLHTLERQSEELETLVKERTTDLSELTERLEEKVQERTEELNNLSQRLQLATFSARLGVWDWNVRNNTMDWDDRMFELYGISREASPNNIDAWQNGLHPEDKESAIAACQAALNGEQEFNTEFRILLPDGAERYIKATGLVIRGNDGTAERMIGINSDITKRKLAEIANTRFLLRQRAILDNLPMMAWLKDTESRLEMVNEPYAKMCNSTVEECIGKTDMDLFPHEMAAGFIADDRQVCQSGMKKHVEELIDSPDGVKWHLTFKTPIFDEHGQVIGSTGIAQDITEIKLAEAELRKGKEHYRAIVDAFEGQIYICSHDFKILYLNEKMIEKIGRNAVGEPCFKALHDLDEVCPWCVNDRINKGETVQWEVQSPKDNRWYYVVNTPINNEDGTISKQAMIQDITERKQGEIDRIHLESQLHQAQKMESVGRLAGGVAHDFNNLLTVILGGTYLALSELEPGQPLHEYVTQIKKAGEKSADLTQQLLAFARKQTIEPKILNLNDSVSGMLKMLQRLIGENTQLAWLPSNNLWAVKADPSQIDQILANLCVNARDSITDIGTITIRTGNSVVDDSYRAEHIDVVPGEYVHISVCDTGCGMDKETLAHIFEPFFTTKGPGDGTGLGLATVYGAAKQNNGFVNVHSEPGIGTTFTIYLPRHVGNTDQNSVKDPMQQAPRGLETILLVEDEPAILNMVTMLLQKQGYTLLAANTPGEATRLASEHSGEIDLLITDVIMPEMKGKDLAHNLISLNPKLMCLFMSGYTADAISQLGVLEEGVHFIHKPFSLPDLAVKVRKVLDCN